VVGEDAVIKIGADIGGAVAGLLAVQTQMNSLNASVVAGAASIRKATMLAGAAFASLGVAAGGVAAVGIAKSVKTFEDYEQQVANAASVTGTMGQAFEDTKANIDDIAKTLGATTVFSAQQAAEAMYDLASAGYNVSDMASSDLKPILDLAAATQEDLTRTTEITTATLGQFQLGISDSKYVTDIFAKTIGSSKATLEKMGLSFKYVGPIANMFGNSVEGVSAALGVMYNNGLRGEQAGRSMRMAFTRLAKPTADVKRVVEELGLTLDDINPDVHEFNDILRTLEGAGIDSAQGLRLFGAEAATGMMAIIENLDVLAGLEDKLGDAGGAAEDMAAKQLDTLKGTSILLTSAIENLKIEIGEKFAPVIREVNMWLRDMALVAGDKVGPVFDRLEEIVTDLRPSFDNIMEIAESLKGIFLDLVEAFGLGGTSAEDITDVINKVTEAIANLLKWVDEHPNVTKFVATIVAAAVAFSFLLPIVTAIASALGMLIGVISTVGAVMAGTVSATTVISAAIAALGGPITLIVVAIALLAAAWATNLFGIRDKVAAFVETVKFWFHRLHNYVLWYKEELTAVLLFLLNPIAGIVYAFKNWSKIKDTVGKITDFIKEKLTSLADSAKDWGKNLLQSFIDGIKDKFSKLREAVSSAAEVVGDYLGFHSPTKEGPGKDVMVWGPNMVDTFAEGVLDNMNVLNNAFSALTAPATTVGTGAGKTISTQTNININIHDAVIREETDIDTLVSKIETAMVNRTRRVNV
jgi:TP901 family phage tail tape measure protein